MFLALFSEYEVNVNVNGSTEPISSIMEIVDMGKKYANGKFHYPEDFFPSYNVYKRSVQMIFPPFT